MFVFMSITLCKSKRGGIIYYYYSLFLIFSQPSSALTTTMIELIGIAIAANNGVTLAIIANGTIKAL